MGISFTVKGNKVQYNTWLNKIGDTLYTHSEINIQTRNVFKKDKRHRIKKREKGTCIHKSYTDDGKLRMIIVKDQWTAILANFVRK